VPARSIAHRRPQHSSACCRAIRNRRSAGWETDMKTVSLWLYRQVACGLMLLLVLPLGVAGAQQTPAAPRPATDPPAQTATQNTASAPAQPANAAAQVASLPDSPTPVPPADPGAQQQTSTQTAPPPQSAPAQPMGTAAAPAEPAGGVAASRPAGAAIAPAKQKRTRSIVIRVSLLVGAAVAIGTVVALSSASPSRP
jgi:hypothetical protein